MSNPDTVNSRIQERQASGKAPDVNDALLALLKGQPGVRHDLVRCAETNAWYHRRSNARVGHWMLQFTCPECGRKGKFQRNYLGQRKVMCDGIKFTKLEQK